MKREDNTQDQSERQPVEPALSSEPLPAELIRRRDQLNSEADALRDEAESLREQAEDIEREAESKEVQAARIDKTLRAAGLLYHPPDAESWGVEIARAIHDSGVTVHMRMLGGDWLSNGQIAWRADSVPDGLREPKVSAVTESFGVELLTGERHAIDLGAPVGTGELSGDRKWSDFKSTAGRARYDDLYWRAVQSVGDAVAVVRVSPTRKGDERPRCLCLVAFRDGKPVAVAMPIAIAESEATP